MSACIGASAAGARAVTASSSQGIMYMMEVLPVASGMRLPILMAVANRAISAPINIHGDHSDAMMMRDTGWIQIFSENAQEAYDNTIMGMKIAEEALLPTAVNLMALSLLIAWKMSAYLKIVKWKDLLGSLLPRTIFLILKIPKPLGR